MIVILTMKTAAAATTTTLIVVVRFCCRYLRQGDHQSMLFVIRSFSEQDYCKSNQLISLKLDVMIGPTNRKNRLTFGCDPVPDTDSWSLFHFPHHRGIGHFRIFVRISHTVTAAHRQIVTIVGEVIDADKVMNPHFESDTADIRIRMRINPEIWIRTADQFGWR